jgi:putative colanic acid biosynthesis UDP-glucose lipid carrier transferase
MAERELGLIRPYSGALVELSRALDALVIIASLWAVSKWAEHPWDNLSSSLALVAGLSFIIAGSLSDLYRSWRSEPMHVESTRILLCWIAAAATTGFVAFGVDPLGAFSREIAWRWFISAPVALLLTRVIVRLALRTGRLRGHNFRRTAIVGSTRIASQLADAILEAPWMGLRFVGVYDDRDPGDQRVVAELRAHFQGNIDELIRRAEAGDVDRVYVTLPLRAELRIKDLIDRLAELPVSVLYVPDFFVFNMLHARWEQVGNLHIVNVVTTPFLGVSGITKRLEDIVLSVAILAIIAIPMLVIALAIKLTSRGPVIFRQRRYGLNGKEFEIWKFRTMTVTEDGDAFVQATFGDSRITPLGHFLRATSLDELPQFINVLCGEMSIVGPRPHPVALDEQHRSLIPRYVLRHKIRPGITGLAQVNGFRGETDSLDKMQKRIESDIAYIDQWSLMLDLKIIFLTLLRGFTDKNAY